MRTFVVLSAALLMLTALSACIEFESGSSQSRTIRRASGVPMTYAPPAPGNMTGDVASDQTTAAVCANGNIQVPPQGSYCAKRTIQIEGSVEALAQLPVSITTFAGGVGVKGGSDGAWSLTAVLEARGDSEAAARTNLEDIEFTWSHEEGAGHHLKALAKKQQQNTNNQERAALSLVVPRSLELFLTAAASSGGVEVTDIKASQAMLTTSSGGVSVNKLDAVWLIMETSSGGIDASDFSAQEVTAEASSGGISLQGAADDVSASTSSGGIEADLVAMNVKLHASSGGIVASITPSATGAIIAQSTSGGVDLAVPEGPKYGYSVEAQASSGGVDIGLQDGKTSGKDNSKSFLTNNYSGRSIRTQVDAQVTSGGVTVGPS